MYVPMYVRTCGGAQYVSRTYVLTYVRTCGGAQYVGRTYVLTYVRCFVWVFDISRYGRCWCTMLASWSMSCSMLSTSVDLWGSPGTSGVSLGISGRFPGKSRISNYFDGSHVISGCLWVSQKIFIQDSCFEQDISCDWLYLFPERATLYCRLRPSNLYTHPNYTCALKLGHIPKSHPNYTYQKSHRFMEQ